MARLTSSEESYNMFYKDLNYLAEFGKFNNKDEFIKFELFLAEKDESYFISKLSDLEYHTKPLSDLLAKLTN